MRINKYILIAGLIFAFIAGYGTSQLFMPTFTETIEEDVERDTVIERDTAIVEREEEIIKPDTAFITDTEIVYVDTSEEGVIQSKISFSDNYIVASHHIYHTGDLVDSTFEYFLRTRLVRDITDTKIITNNIHTTRTITRQTDPSHKLLGSVIASPNLFGATIGFKHRSGIGVSIGQDFHNDEILFMLSVEFTPSDLIRLPFPFN